MSLRLQPHSKSQGRITLQGLRGLLQYPVMGSSLMLKPSNKLWGVIACPMAPGQLRTKTNWKLSHLQHIAEMI